MLDDPDAPGGTFAHWAVFDLGATRSQLAEGAGSAGASALHQARNDFGVVGYRGPCPPAGKDAHHYRFQLFALNVDKLQLGQSPTVSDVQRAMQGHVLDTSTVTVTFGRKEATQPNHRK